MCARKVFYIFSKISDRNQFCAVRQDQPIPPTIDGVCWEYAGCIEMPHGIPFGFDLEEANAAMQTRGIYFYRRAFAFVGRNLLLEAA